VSDGGSPVAPDGSLADADAPARITWVGHSTVLLELGGVRLATDPVLRSRVAHLRRVSPPAAELPALDAVLISHVHYDHLDLPSLRRIRGLGCVVVPRGAGALLRRQGLAEVVEVAVGDELSFGSVVVRVTQASHSARRPGVDRSTDSLGFLVSAGVNVYFAGDTDVFDGMRALAPELDLALLPVAGWGRRVPEGHLDPGRAAEALGLLRPRLAVPIHWGTYRMLALRSAPDVLRVPVEEFKQAAARLAPEVEVVVLAPGSSCTVSRPAGVPSG
jgi:L-ascorbate metabolism protein UlaG (beta-lactamase superfamily)